MTVAGTMTESRTVDRAARIARYERLIYEFSKARALAFRVTGRSWARRPEGRRELLSGQEIGH